MRYLLYILLLTMLPLCSLSADCIVEKKYNKYGPEKAARIDYPLTDCNLKSFTIYYPQSMNSNQQKKYPLIIFANATLSPVSGYPGVLKHLATWGFIAMGSHENWSGKGRGTIAALKFMLAQNDDRNSVFYQHLDTAQIGLAGHSQGGAGIINAATRYRLSHYFKALFTMSCCSRMIAARWPICSPYDPSLIKIPIMMTSSSSPHGWDAVHIGLLSTGLSPLSSLLENRDLISPNGNLVVLARLSDQHIKHSQTMGQSLAYLTAWFRYHLQNDVPAGAFFSGKDPELLRNPRWQDAVIDLPQKKY